MRRYAFAMFALFLVIAHGANIARHVRLAFDPMVFNDDARQQVFPFFRYTPAGTVLPDLPGDYQLALIPVGYKAVIQIASKVIDPVIISKALPFALFIVLLLSICAVSSALGGPVAAWMTLALALQTNVFLYRMGGGLPRAFAFVLLGMGLWALVSGRVRRLAVMVVVASLFYSVASLTLGLMLAALLLLLPAKDRGEASSWNFGRRLLTLAITGATAAAMLGAVSVSARHWGRLLGPGDEQRFPEISAAGRYLESDRIPTQRSIFPGVIREAIRHFTVGLSSERPWSPELQRRLGMEPRFVGAVVLLLTLGGLVPLARGNQRVRRALLLPVAGLMGFVLAQWVAPNLYLPQRYLSFALPLFAVVCVPLAGRGVVELLKGSTSVGYARDGGIIALPAVAIFLLGGRFDHEAGYTTEIKPTHVYEFLATLPQDALLAGWPEGVMDNVPYLARRRVLLNRENHQVFHENYTLEMRRRMNAVVSALFAPDDEALRSLREDFGVTHLVVDTEHFNARPLYFEPFGETVERVWTAGKKAGFATDRFLERGTVFQEGSIVILDLSRL